MKKVTIGISAGRKYENYLNWLNQEPDIELIKLGYEDNNFEAFSKCRALLLTGGEDVHPSLYGKPGFVEQYRLDDIDERRDQFEMKLLRSAHQRHLPILGICRGLQIANVFLGGTLIPDLKAYGKSDHKKLHDGSDSVHQVWLSEQTRLEAIVGTKRGEVNSSHHQCIDFLGDGLAMNCVAPDGVLEGAEFKDVADHPFLVLVQWHPERMSDLSSPFSKNLREAFVESVREFS